MHLTQPKTVNRDIDGLIKSVNDNSTSAFMWEVFTTKPFVDKGDIRLVRVPSLASLTGIETHNMTNSSRSGLSPHLGPLGSLLPAHPRRLPKCGLSLRHCLDTYRISTVKRRGVTWLQTSRLYRRRLDIRRRILL